MLKTSKIQVDGAEVEIAQLNALGQIEIMEAHRALGESADSTTGNARLAAIACARCIVGFAGSPEDVLKEYTLEQIMSIAKAIQALSEGDEKNSESVPSDASSSA